ncbi:MAG: hypothetical protein WD426_03225 [Anditalea sp.]
MRKSRRFFLKLTGLAGMGMAGSAVLKAFDNGPFYPLSNKPTIGMEEENLSIIGQYGQWASSLNKWAADHEDIMAKSLFSAGTTWPGVFYAEDQIAPDVLCDRKDVDADRIGCAGLFPEMKKADDILKAVYKNAKAEKYYRGSFHPGPHKFDKKMQMEAFDWFDQWLKS